MKKFICVLAVSVVALGVYAQEKRGWSEIVRFKTADTVVGLINGGLDVSVDSVTPVSRDVALLAETEVAYASGFLMLGSMGGAELTLAGDVPNSGIYLSAQAGGFLILSHVLFHARADVGYQFVTEGGFVITPAIGVAYNGLTGFGLDVMVDMGFALK